MKYTVRYDDSDKLALLMSELVHDFEEIETECLEEMQPRLKAIAVTELRKLKRIKNILRHRFRSNGARRRTKHMYQDVKSEIKRDEYGYKYLRVLGGRQTGTLWHIVNDGTYRTPATHFMDRISEQAGREFENVVDSALKRRLEDD